MGVKKSTVCTSARCRSSRYTPASSKVFELTSTLRSNEMGSCGKTCRRACWLNLEAHPAHDESEVSFRICSRDIEVTSFPKIWISEFRFSIERMTPAWGIRKSPIQNRKWIGGEDRNRTYLGPAGAESTTVLKTARATRHPSLSRLWIVDCGLRIANDRQLVFAVQSGFYFAFLIALTIASKSGQSPVSSLEWRSLPLARISKAPPLEGMSVSDLMRSPRSRILVAKLTAFGV